MLDIKKIYDSTLDEDGMAAGGGAGAGAVGGGGEIAAPSGVGDADIVKGGMSTEDVLGKDCDHHKHGYLGPGCFHTPSRVCKMKREIPSGIKKKGQKNIYAKGMKILEEAEFDRDIILAIHKVKESDLRNYILKFFHDEIYDAMYVAAIAYFPPTKSFFAKVENDGKWSYVNLDFKNGKFVITDDLNVYSSQEIKDKYKDIAGKNIKVWVCWGGV